LLGSLGARVVIADVRPGALDVTVDELREAGVDAHGVVCDVSKKEDVMELADRSFELLGKVHLVFHNAGVGIGGPLLSVTDEDWELAINVDLWPAIYGVQAFTQRMVAQDEDGHVLFTSSFAGLVANDGLGPYCVAKYGVVALAEVLAREISKTKVGVSVLCPMVVNTGGYSRYRRELQGVSMNDRPWYWGPPRDGDFDTDLIRDGVSAEEVSEAPDTNVMAPEDVAEATLAAVRANRLYILPHEASRAAIRRRFDRIDRCFDI
jgi:NAD(P)-dependent dehydrogenase (short-subunit alcohol dehydrogenase family)